MGALTPSFVVDLETRLTVLAENEFVRLSQNLWWDQVAMKRDSTGKKELLTWLLSTAQIRSRGDGGNISFDDLVSTYHEIVNEDFGAGLRLKKQKLEDVDGGGVDLAGQWFSDIGAKMAYHPQKQVADFLKTGGTPSYDGLSFFNASHPVDPNDAAKGTYANLLTGSGYAIDDSVTAEAALVNLAKVVSHIAGIKMPDGETPRMLRPKAIICGPRLFPRAVQLNGAKFLGGTSGAQDVEALIKALGFARPVQADELYGFESNTTYFVVCEAAMGSSMAGIIYQEREPFNIAMYGEMTEAELSRRDEFEWHCKGRNVTAAGHPYMIVKVSPST